MQVSPSQHLHPTRCRPPVRRRASSTRCPAARGEVFEIAHAVAVWLSRVTKILDDTFRLRLARSTAPSFPRSEEVQRNRDFSV